MIGTFSDTENADTCTECPTGYTTSKEGSDQRELCTGGKFYIYRPQRSWGKVMFLQASVILLTGGGVLDQVHPQDQVYPPGPGTPPGTRYTPMTRYTPLGPGTPPQTRYIPPDQVHPWDQVHLPGPGTPPWDQVHPPGPGTPPGTRYSPPGPGTAPRRRACWQVRSTRGRYASYWNAILFSCLNLCLQKVSQPIMLEVMTAQKVTS